MRQLAIISQREFASYFATPLAYLFTVIFLVLAGIFTFYQGSLYERGQADLAPFFQFLPWLYLVLVPAIAMRLWAEERRSGTIELLMTLPVKSFTLVLGKFIAAWLFIGLALALTAPLWVTVNYLGDPDNGAIFAGYLGSWLMAGAFLAIGCCLSATTKSQVIAFILTLVVCFVFVAAGFSMVLDAFQGWLPVVVLDGISSMSFLTHFRAISRGVIEFTDLFFFVSVIIAFLAANAVVIELKKAD